MATSKQTTGRGSGGEVPTQPFAMAAGPLGSCIPIKDTHLIRHLNPLLPDGHLSIHSTGRSGSGKSRSILQLLPSIANLKQVCVLSLVPNNPTMARIREWCENTIGPDSYAEFCEPMTASAGIEDFLSRLNPEGASSGAQDVQKQNWAIMIADDFMIDDRKASPYRLCIDTCVRLLRNMHCHMWFLGQSYTDAPPAVRANSNIRFIFEMSATRSIEAAAKDWVSNGYGTTRRFGECLDEMKTGGPFSYLMLVNKCPEHFIWCHKHSNGPTHLERLGALSSTRRGTYVRRGVPPSESESESDESDDDNPTPRRTAPPLNKAALIELLRSALN